MEYREKRLLLQKRVLALVLLLFVVLPISSSAEERTDYYGLYLDAKEAGDEEAMARIRAEMPSRLHPAMDDETGLWGYIDYLGEWAILPRYGSADVFRGEYAAASTGDPWDYTAGLIRRDGSWVVEPRYFVDHGYDGWTYGGLDTGMYLVWDGEGYMGFFDVRSGFLSPDLGENTWWSDAELLPLTDYDDETNEPTAYYISRATGETAFRLEGYEADYLGHTSEFYNGFAMVYDTDGGEHIINERGEILPLPENLRFYGEGAGLKTSTLYYRFGLLLCLDTDTGLYGWWDLNAMDWRVQPRYEWAGNFSEDGYACVRAEDGTYGHIDVMDNLVVDGFACAYDFFGGYAYVAEEHILMDPMLETVLLFDGGWEPRIQWDDECDHSKDYYVSPGGVISVFRDDPLYPGLTEMGLMTLDGEWLLESGTYYRNWGISFAVESHRFFSEGLQAVRKRVGIREWRNVHNTKTGDYKEPVYETRVGYVDESGNIAVDFLYDDGGAFLGGLALVQRGGEKIYVDAFGHEVFSWHNN